MGLPSDVFARGLAPYPCLCGIASEESGLVALDRESVTAGTIRLGGGTVPDYALRRRRSAMRAVSTVPSSCTSA